MLPLPVKPLSALQPVIKVELVSEPVPELGGQAVGSPPGLPKKFASAKQLFKRVEPVVEPVPEFGGQSAHAVADSDSDLNLPEAQAEMASPRPV